MKKKSFNEVCSIKYPTAEVETSVVGYPKVVQKTIDGKVVNQIEFVVEPESEASKYKVSDFALENLLAAGVQLKEMSFNVSGLNTVDRVVNEVESLKND